MNAEIMTFELRENRIPKLPLVRIVGISQNLINIFLNKPKNKFKKIIRPHVLGK